jgi:transcriptional regulator with XRE-family HTH domain
VTLLNVGREKMYSKTEMKSILRIHQTSFSELTGKLGITRSYLSKILSKAAPGAKYEKLIQLEIASLQKQKPKNINRNATWGGYGRPIGIKNIPLKNTLCNMLGKKKASVTKLADDIHEARSAVSEVLNGLRKTERIQEKIINYLGLDFNIFYTCRDSLSLLKAGYLLPPPTKEDMKNKGKYYKRLEAIINDLTG